MVDIIVGIDFSKKTFDATLLDKREPEQGKKRAAADSHRQFSNNAKGFKQCLSWVKILTRVTSLDECLFCGEDTGHCSLRMANYLHSKGLFVWIESPLRIKRSMGIVRGKSDKADSLRISDYAWRHQDKARRYVPANATIASLREVFNARLKYVEMRKALEVRNKDFDDMGKELGNSKFIKATTKPIIEGLKKSIAECNKEMKRLIDGDNEIRATYENITSIKGISLINAVALIAYTNNFKDFDGNPRKIATYWGVAVFSETSGTSVHKAARTCPMASRTLKALITEAAWTAIKWEPRIRDYYNGLISRGKQRGVALNNVKNKLIHIVTALAVNGTTYDPGYEQNRRNKQYAQNTETRFAG